MDLAFYLFVHSRFDKQSYKILLESELKKDCFFCFSLTMHQMCMRLVVPKVTQERLIEMNQNRLKMGELCRAIPSGMELCCEFMWIKEIEEDFSDGSGY